MRDFVGAHKNTEELVAADGNNYSQKYVQNSDATYGILLQNISSESFFIFKDGMHRQKVTPFLREWKIKTKISGMT